MTLVKFNSQNKKNGALPEMSNVFDSIFNDTFFADRLVSRVPATNISESTDNFHIELAAPGLQKDDFRIKLDGDVLTISVDKSYQDDYQDRNYAKREFSYTSFTRSFTLPETANAEQIDAKYNDGILTINIAKREEAKMVSRQIEIE
ncbi:Hsp20/alpha crystallin family protein [Pedobacter jejuensis]|uniref:Hsp20/alpha crystallin family protein n=1 Tax=Pedobacter jejuensis TaxID=1268550 RepID=A0A3N0C180_9SPHI|nr:Hsp20/alpha crystallin family protein [Pedobacter jejuensis]RNL55786.1 Hsp20/alpha crystallin family protein [Pedobacter jejuensis]